MIDPNKSSRKLVRYRGRRKIKRLLAWLKKFKRLVVRYENYVGNLFGMVQLGCVVILLRYFLDDF
jgi:transposase